MLVHLIGHLSLSGNFSVDWGVEDDSWSLHPLFPLYCSIIWDLGQGIQADPWLPSINLSQLLMGFRFSITPPIKEGRRHVSYAIKRDELELISSYPLLQLSSWRDWYFLFMDFVIWQQTVGWAYSPHDLRSVRDFAINTNSFKLCRALDASKPPLW